MFLYLLACTEPATTSNDKPSDAVGHDSQGTTDSQGDADADSDADADADADSDADTDTDSDTDSGQVEQDPVIARFVALGDAGKGNEDQYAVAAVMKTVCEAQGCDFALYLGDNMYDNGVDSAEDDQFQEKFELPYADLDFPFYAVLGNHDYGGLGTGVEFWKGPYEVEYTDHSDKWTMPDEYYRQDLGDLSIYGLDTNSIFWGLGADQQTWLENEIDTNPNRWNLVFGHHCYRSNGQHGNAGEYEGFEWLPVANGQAVEDFVDTAVCGRADVYFAGHDHLREWVGETCGTEFIVSGAGSQTTDIVDRGNTTKFESDVEGFTWVEIKGDTMTVQFWNTSGVMDYSDSFTK